MAGMEPESVDAIVTDPPYGLKFMGKGWDDLNNEMVGDMKDISDGPMRRMTRSLAWGGRVDESIPATQPGTHSRGMADVDWHKMQRWHQRWAEAAYRVAKPSAYLLAFGGTRTVHRMTVALEDAGWIIRDMLVWGYASGFPKSKASLKPAWEPIVMARKPGPLRMLAIDECRIGYEDTPNAATNPKYRAENGYRNERGADPSMFQDASERAMQPSPLGRWPANIVLTDPIFDGGIEGVVGGGETASGSREGAYAAGGFLNGSGPVTATLVGDSGTYSRFFLIPKADRADREPVLGGLPLRVAGIGDERPSGEFNERLKGTTTAQRANVHPTVKPTDLMRHLVRLVTPTGGTVLDPFLGSGTTGLAAEMEGFGWIGIEREAEYVTIAEARLNGTQRGLGLVG
jgi:site-specific DNA-methyltransferase (adenine-specific)